MVCQSMVDLRRRLSRGLSERRMRMRAPFRGRDVVWIGTRCLTLEIRGIASAGCIFGRPVPGESISYDSKAREIGSGIVHSDLPTLLISLRPPQLP